MLLKDHDYVNKDRISGMISLVIPVYKTEHLLDRCLESIMDQSYDNWEAIVVFDGDSNFDCNKYTDKRIQFIKFTENRGVCFARNKGLLLSKGEFISCFSSDFIMKEGCLSEWIRLFIDNPEYEFLYGPYELLDDPEQNMKGAIFHSQSFDPKVLEQKNYIDGGFPVRWDKSPMWNESFTSLNDWVWALEMVKMGYKGYFMKDFISYSAEPPKPNGLSFHSHRNWEDTYNRILSSFNIKKPDVNVVSFGAEFHAKALAEKFGWHYNNLVVNKTYNYKHIHFLGCYHSAIEGILQTIYNNPKSTFSIHWIGSDIREFYEQLPMIHIEEIKKNLLSKAKVQFSECKRTQKILKKVGIITEILPLPVSLPKYNSIIVDDYRKRVIGEENEYSVGIYLPVVENDKYYAPLMFRIINALPFINFKIFGNRDGKVGIDPNAKNCEFLGWIPIEEILTKVDCLLRLTPFDGLSISAIEFLMCKKDVITNHDIDGSHIIDIDRECLKYMIPFHNALNDTITKIISVKEKRSRPKKVFNSQLYTTENFIKTFKRSVNI